MEAKISWKIIFGIIGFGIVLGVLQYFHLRGALRSPDQSSKSNYENPSDQVAANKVEDISNRAVTVTNGIKHSIPLDEIISGGPPKDGIPPIDKPKFVTAGSASYLNDSDPGIALEIDSVSRFYPFQILVWHEIVNDTIKGRRVLVTYCPLCRSAIVFDPVVKGERVEFGTSGKLWNSNLLMYDRKTDSLWSQILGEAVVGEMTGAALKVLPSDIVRFGDWKRTHKDGEVLSRDTGAIRVYGIDPYGDYYTSAGVYFPVKNKDNRLGEKEFVLGIVIDGKAKAYLPSAVKKVSRLEDKFAGKDIVVKYESDIDAVRIFEKRNGEFNQINPFPSFWFAWAAAHPGTDLYK